MSASQELAKNANYESKFENNDSNNLSSYKKQESMSWTALVVVYFDQQMGDVQNVWDPPKRIFFSIPPLQGLLPVLGPLERYMTPTLDLALLISSWAGADKS